jgi:hypothetical protein
VLGAIGSSSVIVLELMAFFFGGAIVGFFQAENMVGVSVWIRRIFPQTEK